MAVCNIFKTLTKETGTFLTFSQYMEDLTKWQTESKYHKVIPSKFIALDCKLSGYDNRSFPKYLQDKFENACAVFKNGDWSPEYSKTLFWNTMFESGFMNPIQTLETDSLPYIQEIKYVGDINLQSYNNVDGVGYSEIYCHIPNEASSYRYFFNTNDLLLDVNYTAEIGEIIQGYQEGELNGDEKIQHEYQYSLQKAYHFSWEDQTINSIKLEDKSFNINLIVVLYDVLDENGVKHTGIPMGIYITGLIDGSGNIQNNIIKYVSNEDIYNSGTSYGLRICSRYVVSQEQTNYIVKDVTIEDNNYGDLSHVLSQLSISQNKMDKIINKTYNTEQNYKNLLSIFKNSRTNVPYIKDINDEPCWFVNGRMLGKAAINYVYTPYTVDEMDLLLGKNSISQSDKLKIMSSIGNLEGQYIFNKLESGPQNIILNWDVYYGGDKINPSNIIIEYGGEKINPIGTNQITINGIDKTTEFTISVEFRGEKVTVIQTVYFVYPSYFGELNGGVEDLPKYLNYTCDQTYSITTSKSNPGAICYAYPQSFRELELITDDRDFIYYELDGKTVNDRFERVEDVINGIDYYIYTLPSPAYVTKYTFNFIKDKVNNI